MMGHGWIYTLSSICQMTPSFRSITFDAVGELSFCERWYEMSNPTIKIRFQHIVSVFYALSNETKMLKLHFNILLTVS